MRPQFANEILNSVRRIYSTLIQVITGHNFLARHQFVIDSNQKNFDPEEGQSAECPLCEEGPQTSEHVIGQCGVLNQIRYKYFNYYQLTPPFVGLRKRDIVGFLRETRIDALAFFMEDQTD